MVSARCLWSLHRRQVATVSNVGLTCCRRSSFSQTACKACIAGTKPTRAGRTSIILQAYFVFGNVNNTGPNLPMKGISKPSASLISTIARGIISYCVVNRRCWYKRWVAIKLLLFKVRRSAFPGSEAQLRVIVHLSENHGA